MWDGSSVSESKAHDVLHPSGQTARCAPKPLAIHRIEFLEDHHDVGRRRAAWTEFQHGENCPARLCAGTAEETLIEVAQFYRRSSCHLGSASARRD